MLDLTRDNYKEYFVSSTYSNLGVEDRKSLIEFAAQQVARDNGLEGHVSVEFMDWDSSSRGSMRSYEGGLGTRHEMRLNSDVLTSKSDTISYEAFNTVNHELHHSLQYEIKADDSNKNSNPGVAELRGTNTHYYDGDSDLYINGDGYDVGYNMYSAQALEVQAREAGLDAVRRMAEENAAKGIEDPSIAPYIEETAAEELAQKQDNIASLGAHPREQMLREGFKHTEGVNIIDRHRALKEARKQDFEDFKAVYGDTLDDKQLAEAFNKNTIQEDFFKTKAYKEGYKADRERYESHEQARPEDSRQQNTENVGESDEQFFGRTAGEDAEPLTESLTEEEDKSGIFYDGWDNENSGTAGENTSLNESDEQFFDRTGEDATAEGNDDGESDSAFFSRTSGEDAEESREEQNNRTVSSDTGENQSAEMTM